MPIERLDMPTRSAVRALSQEFTPCALPDAHAGNSFARHYDGTFIAQIFFAPMSKRTNLVQRAVVAKRLPFFLSSVLQKITLRRTDPHGGIQRTNTGGIKEV